MKVYDMYARFIRWASDRLNKNGVIAFVSNNSFVDARTYDGFRKVVADEFNEIHIVDMKGNARTSGERRRREGGNVFSDEIRVGVAVYFLVRKEGAEGCKIFYNCIDDYARAEVKKAYLRDHKFKDLIFDPIHPDENHNWINLADNDFASLFPLVSGGGMKLGKSERLGEKALFDLFSFGVVTNRDEWVYDFSEDDLSKKVNFLIDKYNSERTRLAGTDFDDDDLSPEIKWTQDLKRFLRQNIALGYEQESIRESIYRPFVKSTLYLNKFLNWSHYKIPHIFPGVDSSNLVIMVGGYNRKQFSVLVSDSIPNLNFYGDPAQCLPLYRYNSLGQPVENITDYGLKEFRVQYTSPDVDQPQISKRDIFHYVYAVLHHPAYRETYENNLKREFPRIPFYDDFWQWAGWGRQLMALHLNYETAPPYALERIERDPSNSRTAYKSKLRAVKDQGVIELDNLTSLAGIPPEAWTYRLGNRSALEWILDRYKERKPKDPTIREKFNTYQFLDYKEEVVDLLQRVCTVSVETMKIVDVMKES
jgi:predicted helicase